MNKQSDAPVADHEGDLPREELERTAYHEAGHAVMAYTLGYRYKFISIQPIDGESGRVMFAIEERIFWHDILILFAGHAAEVCYSDRGYMDGLPHSFWAGAEKDYDKAFAIGLRHIQGHNIDRIALLKALSNETNSLIKSQPLWKMVESLAKVLLIKESVDYDKSVRILKRAGGEEPGFYTKDLKAVFNKKPVKKRDKLEPVAYRVAGQAAMRQILGLPPTQKSIEPDIDCGAFSLKDLNWAESVGSNIDAQTRNRILITYAGDIAEEIFSGRDGRHYSRWSRDNFSEPVDRVFFSMSKESELNELWMIAADELFCLWTWIWVKEVAKALLARPHGAKFLKAAEYLEKPVLS